MNHKTLSGIIRASCPATFLLAATLRMSSAATSVPTAEPESVPGEAIVVFNASASTEDTRNTATRLNAEPIPVKALSALGPGAGRG